MKICVYTILFCLGTALGVSPVFGQQDENLRVVEPRDLHIISDHQARESLGHSQVQLGAASAQPSAQAASSTLPLWAYSVKATQDGNTYSGQIVGTAPSTNTTTTVPTILIPVILKITQGSHTYVFDPTSGDPGCIGAGNTAFALTQNSPLFQNAPFTMNNANVGDTQYGDANLRGEFWSTVKNNSSYHLRLSATTKPALTISVSAGRRGNTTAEVYSLSGGQCGSAGSTNPAGKLAVININTMDAYLQSYINANGLDATQFPFFVTYNAVMSDGAANNSNNCCILGYHNALGNPGQTYGIAEFEGRDQTVFSGVSDVSAASHEINEWINDPSGSNPTPSWGNVGQVSGCQANFEVGDPLSGTLRPTVTVGNFSYHLQELAFYSWFYGGTSLGAGGNYSNNGTFTGPAKLCPPGGTN